MIIIEHWGLPPYCFLKMIRETKEPEEEEKEEDVYLQKSDDIGHHNKENFLINLNADETDFQILPMSIKTWAFKNSKNVSINVKDNDKERVSIMATISSENEKFPLFIIAKAN